MDENAETIEAQAVDFIELTADIVSAYVSNNSVRPADMAELIASTHAALSGLGTAAAPAAPAVEKPTPAQIRKSITPDALISFIDGKPYKTLKRHLTGNGMTIEQYRQRYGLPRDYPSTAASYSASARQLAKSLASAASAGKRLRRLQSLPRPSPRSRSGLAGRGRPRMSAEA